MRHSKNVLDVGSWELQSRSSFYQLKTSGKSRERGAVTTCVFLEQRNSIFVVKAFGNNKVVESILTPDHRLGRLTRRSRWLWSLPRQ
jgi:hypothetical protein